MRRMKVFFILTVILGFTLLNVFAKDNHQNLSSQRHYQVIDVHNHDSPRYHSSINIWNKYDILQVVLFGAISEPAAVPTDGLTWKAYGEYPQRIIPFFAGIDVHRKNGLKMAKEYLEKGYLGIGEVVAASQYSPVTSKLAWKGLNPMDGYFPQLYSLCAQYQAPILLHIDPPNGYPIEKLKEALGKYPNTKFILAHANAYNDPSSLAQLLESHDNLYIDFFAGFTVFDSNSTNSLDDFIPLIKKYNTRFLVSTDSGFGISYDDAYQAIFLLLDKLDEDSAQKVGALNMRNIIAAEPITKTQRMKIEQLKNKKGIEVDLTKMNKQQANEFIFSNQ